MRVCVRACVRACGRAGVRACVRVCMCQLLGFLSFHLTLRSYDYDMHIEALRPASLWIVTLLSSEQYAPFERFRLQQMVKEIPVSKQT